MLLDMVRQLWRVEFWLGRARCSEAVEARQDEFGYGMARQLSYGSLGCVEDGQCAVRQLGWVAVGKVKVRRGRAVLAWSGMVGQLWIVAAGLVLMRYGSYGTARYCMAR